MKITIYMQFYSVSYIL